MSFQTDTKVMSRCKTSASQHAIFWRWQAFCSSLPPNSSYLQLYKEMQIAIPLRSCVSVVLEQSLPKWHDDPLTCSTTRNLWALNYCRKAKPTYKHISGTEKKNYAPSPPTNPHTHTACNFIWVKKKSHIYLLTLYEEYEKNGMIL